MYPRATAPGLRSPRRGGGRCDAGRTPAGAAGPHVHRRLRDPRQRVSEASRRWPVLSPGVRRGGPAPGSLLDDRHPPASGDPWGGRQARRAERRRVRSRRSMPAIRSARSRTSSRRRAWRRPSVELAFHGGAVGFFGYDLVRRVERLPDEPRRRPRHPRHRDDDHRPRRAVRPPEPIADARRAMSPGSRPTRSTTSTTKRSASCAKSRCGCPAPCRSAPRPDLRSRSGRSRAIRPGRTSSRRWSASASMCSPVTRSRWCRRSASPRGTTSTRSPSTGVFAPSTRRPTCSSWTSATSRSSARRPRCWCKVDDGAVETRPIAGTRPRGETLAEDQRAGRRAARRIPRNAPSTSCWWTSVATTSGGSRGRVPCGSRS